MRKTWLALFLVLLLAVPCLGAEQGENFSDEKGADSEAAQAVADAALAGQLAEMGRAEKSPMLLASAAQILGGIGTFEEAKYEKTADSTAPESSVPETKDRPGGDANDTAESLYSEAAALAKANGDAALAEILEQQSRVGAGRGRTSGAGRTYDTVYGRDTYSIRFTGGRRAEVTVVGDGDDVDLYVYDENGNLIGKDTRSGTVARVSWTPRWTGNFRVVVVNADNVSYIEYSLTTN